MTRTDIAAYPMPVKELVRKNPEIPSDFRDLVGNMIYVGVLSQILGIDLAAVRAALEFHFKGKAKPIDMNFHAVEAGATWASAKSHQERSLSRRADEPDRRFDHG